jgi:hypothetical protein
MSRSSSRKIGFIFVIATILFSGGLAAIAEPGYTIECGTCHTVNPSYTMGSNSTGNAILGIPFTLTVNASKPSGGGGKFLLSVQSGWADNSEFNFTPIEIEDNDSEDLDSSRFSITCELTFTPENSGLLTIRAWCSTNGGSQSLDIPIDVEDPTPTTTTSTSTTTTTTTASTTPDTSTISSQPSELIIDNSTLSQIGVVVATWVTMIIVVVVISEVLIRKGRW